MSNLIELLTGINHNNKNNFKIKPTQNFILQILKDLEPKKAIDLLKNLNLSDNEIKKIISKLPQKDKKIFTLLLSENKIGNFIKTPLNKTENENIKKLKKNLEKLITEISSTDNSQTKNNHIIEKKFQSPKKANKNQSLNIFPSTNLENILSLIFDTPKSLPQKIKKDLNNIKQNITELIKREIDTYQTIDNETPTKKITEKIKNINSFEELVSVADKNGLNIKKFIIKIIKPQEQPKYLPQPKINNLKISKNNINIFISKHQNKNNNILQTLITHKNKNPDNNIPIENKTDITKHNHNNEKTDILINNFHPDSEIKHKIIKAKDSIKHFSNNLKEAIENYKPPISKLSIELHPKELGKVQVTIIHRGDNLQININSNNQAVNFFHLHQTELKNTLINMGYNGIDMNFNSNQNRENQGKKTYKNYSANKKDKNYDELIIEIPYTYA